MNSTEKTPLYQQPIRIPSWKSAPLSLSCQMVGGRNGNPQNFMPDIMGTTDCRLTAGSKARHRIPVDVKPCSGYVDASKAGVNQHRCYSKREMRALAIKVLIERGIPVNKKSIAGILSGKTLRNS
jgi:hypothetical protein